MTLATIISTPNYVVAAADRRLTFADGRPAADLSTKVVLLHRSIVVAYAGVANLDDTGRHFDHWIADNLSAVRSPEVLSRLRRLLDETWSSTSALAGKPFAVVGAEWVPHADGRVRPRTFWISNAMDQRGNWNPYNVRPRFTRTSLTTPPRGLAILTAGFATDNADEQQLGSALQKYFVLAPAQIPKLRETVLEFQHDVGDMSDGVIGRQTNVVIIPTAAVPFDGVADSPHNTPPSSLREVTSWTYSDVKSRASYVTSFAPSVIGPYVTIIGAESRYGAQKKIGPRPELR